MEMVRNQMKMNASRILLDAAVCAFLLALMGAPETASAQQVEVVADETPLRLDPDPGSPVITTLPAGAVLEWVGESGEWYAVSVPGPPGQEDLVGYVLASEVRASGAPQPLPGAPPPGLPTGGMPIPGVQQQHGMAKQNRASGARRAVQGAALAATAELSVSLFFEVEDRESYEDEAAYQAAVDREETAHGVRNAALVVGGALVAYGIGRYVMGWRKMAELEEQYPEATTPPLDRQYAEASLNRSLGRRKVIWGVILAGASYATVELVPHFAAPNAEDFEDAAEYQSALNRRDKAVTARNVIGAVGGALGVWGIAQWVLSAQKMAEIEEISSMTTALSVPLEPWGSGSPVKLFAGRADGRTQLGVAWSW